MRNLGNILVFGGAGYIGSHTCRALSKKGFTPVVFDDLSNGHREFVKWGPLYTGNIRNKLQIKEAFQKYAPIGVINFAGLIEVGQSMLDPISYYDTNVGGALNVIDQARKHGSPPIVFSSTCATYGLPKFMPMTEDHPQEPINPYGRSKLQVEQALRDASEAGQLRSMMLRYFNAAGASPDGEIGEWHTPETHAIPLILRATTNGQVFKIFGTDFPTPDGTCIRDYIHVCDLADAHVKALEYLLDGGKTNAVNLGTGVGTSVLELIETIRKVTKLELIAIEHDRRPGDAPILVADNHRARSLLNWEPKYDINDIILSAFEWSKKMSKELA